jgi:chemotaxis protein methyltransferase CheR
MDDVGALELDLFIAGVQRQYGRDLRQFAPGPLQRHVLASVRAEGLTSISALQALVLRDPAALQRLLNGFARRRPGLFAAPDFARFFVTQAIPLLRTYPTARIWLVGCATGEAAYGLAALLAEAGALDRCHIYATDTDAEALAIARQGRYAAETVQRGEAAYRAAGGTRLLAGHVTLRAGQARIRPALQRHVVFAEYDLATDASFNEFHLIIGRDALRHGSGAFRRRAYDLFHASLPVLGMLAVGRADGFRENPRATAYQSMAGWDHVYRRMR